MQLPEALARFQLSDPHLLARTRTSTLWTVTTAHREIAVLKLLQSDEIEEARGAAFLASLAGHGAARVLARDGRAS